MAVDTNAINIKGIASWAHVIKPEEWEGQPTGYSICVEMPEENLEKFKAYIENFWEEHKDELGDKKLNPKAEFLTPVKEDANGTEIVKAKTLHYYKNRKTGEITPKTLPVFKADNTPLEKGVLIGNGSEVRVNVTPHVVYVNSKKYGVGLYLNAVQVLALKEYTAGSPQTADSFGFEATETPEEEVEF